MSPSTDNPERFTAGARMFARPRGAAAGGGRLVVVDSVRGDPALPIVSFAGITHREEAEELHGALLEIPSSELPTLQEGEYYPFELEGLEARDPAGRRFGIVSELLEAPANDVLTIQLDAGRVLLVPFVMDAVPEVHLDQGYLVIEERFFADTEPGG